jgi:DNA-binding response OmpR family regulator
VTRVLVVEDDCDIRSMLERGLAAEGFDVSVAGRGFMLDLRDPCFVP